MAHKSALCKPQLSVHVENPLAKEITKDLSEGLAFGEVVEVCLEYVLNILWVCCDNGSSCTKPLNHYGVGGGLTK